MIVINITPSPNQMFQVTLDGQYCTILLRWKGNRLYMDLSQADAPVCNGAICVNLASIVQSPTANFRGSLYFVDTLGDEPPVWTLLNDRFFLVYYSEDEDIPERLVSR